MKVKPINLDGYQLLHDGVRELAGVEAAGIRVDVPRLQRTKKDLKQRVRETREAMEADPLWKKWKRRYGEKANPFSRVQLRYIIYSELQIEVSRETESGEASTDDVVLQGIDHPFIRNLEAHFRYDKTLRTFLRGIETEIVGDRIHPSFDLHTARTFRSSSSEPNFQNFPVRNKEIMLLIRSLFIPSDGCLLSENDFKGIEVSVSACYHKDPNFISYITTPGKDMHRDMAAQIYCLSPEQVSKDARYGAKNKFVFPQFYGDYYIQCARNLWEWIDRGGLKGPDGRSLKNHLKENGIRKLGRLDPSVPPRPGTFEAHLKNIEDDFWNRRFAQYGRWRREFYSEYLDRGYFDMLSGFRVRGAYSRNQVTNAPVQGSAFHCLLWSLIRISRKLKRYGMRSRIVGQIHDSLIADVPVGEFRDYQSICEEVTTVELRKHFDWLVVPLEIEREVPPEGKPWSMKREYEFRDRRFKLPDRDVWTGNTKRFLKAIARKKARDESLPESRSGHRRAPERDFKKLRE